MFGEAIAFWVIVEWAWGVAGRAGGDGDKDIPVIASDSVAAPQLSPCRAAEIVGGR